MHRTVILSSSPSRLCLYLKYLGYAYPRKSHILGHPKFRSVFFRNGDRSIPSWANCFPTSYLHQGIWSLVFAKKLESRQAWVVFFLGEQLDILFDVCKVLIHSSLDRISGLDLGRLRFLQHQRDASRAGPILR